MTIVDYLIEEDWFDRTIRAVVNEFTDNSDRVQEAAIREMTVEPPRWFSYGRYDLAYDKETNTIFARVQGETL